MKIKIVCSKTDQLKKFNGDDRVLVARTRYSTCPVAMIEHYLSRTSMEWSDVPFLTITTNKERRDP